MYNINLTFIKYHIDKINHLYDNKTKIFIRYTLFRECNKTVMKKLILNKYINCYVKKIY